MTTGSFHQRETFHFNSNLDRALLEELYAGDIEYAMTVFNIFLTHSLSEFKELRKYIEHGDWTRITQLAHKLKPNFSMVGLPKLEQKMLEIEEMARMQGNCDSLAELYEEIENMLSTFLPILDADLKKMRQILKVV